MRTDVAIIGAGLAGAAAAFKLQKSGLRVTVYEQGDSAASGASGNAIGMYNPRLTARPSLESDFYAAAFYHALEVLPTIHRKHDIGFDPCGSLLLMTDERKRRKYEGASTHLGWPKEECYIASAEEATSLAGVLVRYDSLVLTRSGCVSPSPLVRALLAGVNVMYQTKIDKILYEPKKKAWSVFAENEVRAEAKQVIVANSLDALLFDPLSFLPLRAVRGQISHVTLKQQTPKPKMNLCYGGYLSATNINGVHAIGATFDKGDSKRDFRPHDQKRNLNNLAEYFPEIAKAVTLKDGRAGVRCTSPDHFPICGAVDGSKGLFVSLAHGSHGILSSLLCGEFLAEQICGKDASVLPQEIMHRLSPQRLKANVTGNEQ